MTKTDKPNPFMPHRSDGHDPEPRFTPPDVIRKRFPDSRDPDMLYAWIRDQPYCDYIEIVWSYKE